MITHVKHKALILESIWRDRSLLLRRGGRGAWVHGGIGRDYEPGADRHTDRMPSECVCVCVCARACEQGVCIPTGPLAPSFHRDPLKNTHKHTQLCKVLVL